MRHAALLLLLVPSIAVAQPSQTSDPGQMKTDDCARARRANKTCVLDIPAEDVPGGVPGSEGILIQTRPWTQFNSLIRIRMDFLAEIIKSANDIE